MRAFRVAPGSSRWILMGVLVWSAVSAETAYAQTPLEAAIDVAEQASLDKVAAERVRAEKIAAQQSANTTAQLAAEALAKARESKTAAERVGAADAQAIAEKIIAALEAESAAHKAAVEKANAERNAAETAVQERTNAFNEANQKVTAARTPLDQAAGQASKEAEDALAARDAAQNTLNQVTNTGNAAITAAATSQEGAMRTEAERAAAEKAVTDQSAALTASVATLSASQNAANQATAEMAAAAAAVEEKTNAARAAVELAATSQAAASRGAAEQAAAARVVEEKSAAAKTAVDAAAAEPDAARKAPLQEAANRAVAELAAAGQRLAELTTAAKTSLDKAAADRTASDAAIAARAGAEARMAEESAESKIMADQVAVNQMTVDRLTAEKANADKALAEKAAAAKAASEKAAADKAVADKALADRTAGQSDLTAKTAAERTARHKAAEARAIADGGLKLLPESAWDLAKARHLLVRAGFGGTPDEVARLHEMGLVRAVEYLVDYQYIANDANLLHVDPPERPAPTESKLSDAERNRLNQRRDATRNNDYYRLRNWWMRRLVESPRPLQEKLTLFWHGHFASEWQKIAWPHLMYNQNQLLRDHANGNLGALLYGIVHDPAMIVYLDNQVNYKGHPNQNLARELMELFAMGVNQGYTEYDLREGARALTGYSYEPYTGQFRFNYGQHDADPKTIFGQTGNWTGDDFVNLILQQPHTARYISGKLFEYFAYANPDPPTVTRLANVLRSNQFELGPMLKNLFMSEEFYGPRSLGTQIKSPVHLLAGLLRDFGVKGADYNAINAWTSEMGQELLQPPNVKGWYGGRDWINANLIFRRYNFAAALVQSAPGAGGQQGIDLVAALDGKGCATAEQVVDYLAKCCLIVPISAEQRQSLIETLGELPAPDQWSGQRDALNAKFRQVLILIVSTPEYQMT